MVSAAGLLAGAHGAALWKFCSAAEVDVGGLSAIVRRRRWRSFALKKELIHLDIAFSDVRRVEETRRLLHDLDRGLLAHDEYAEVVQCTGRATLTRRAPMLLRFWSGSEGAFASYSCGLESSDDAELPTGSPSWAGCSSIRTQTCTSLD